MCKFGCDELFENGYIVVKDGIISSLNKKPSTDDIEIYINTIIIKTCTTQIKAKSFSKYIKLQYKPVTKTKSKKIIAREHVIN